MVNKELEYNGIHIFYKDGKRFINYGNNTIDCNAGKYYYLYQLSTVYRTENNKASGWMNVITYIYNNTSTEYNEEVVNTLFRKLPNNSHTDNENFMIFCVIYLAMLDLEANTKYPSGSGKQMVYNSCREVLINGMDYQKAATLYEKRSSNNMQDVNVEDEFNNGGDDYGKSGEHYGWYNGYSDDAIDDGFDGDPMATWNVD